MESKKKKKKFLLIEYSAFINTRVNLFANMFLNRLINVSSGSDYPKGEARSLGTGVNSWTEALYVE